MSDPYEPLLAENEIFILRKKADLLLQAGDTATFERIQGIIQAIQANTGATKGVRREMDNDKTRTA